MRVIDEDTLMITNAEFLIKQETNASSYIKDQMFNTQLIRTTD